MPRAVVAELQAAGRMAVAQGKISPAAMPTLAGEDMHLHDAVAYWESTQAALAHAGLLKAAMGMEPDDALKIVDTNLGDFTRITSR